MKVSTGPYRHAGPRRPVGTRGRVAVRLDVRANPAKQSILGIKHEFHGGASYDMSFMKKLGM